MKYSIYCYYVPVNPHQHLRHYLFSFQFSYNCFLTFFFLIFTLLQPFFLPYHFISPLLLQFFSLPYLFISPLPFTLISFFIFPFIFYFCLFLFTPFYYKFVTIFSILFIVFSHNKKDSLSLSNFWWIFLFFLHICFKLIIFYIL